MRVMKIPKSEYRAYSVDPRRFLRDMLNVSGKAEEPFVLHPDKIKKCFNYNIPNPFDEKTLTFDTEWVCKNPDKLRFIHIDLAQNRCGAGISCCHESHIEDIIDREGNIRKHSFVQFDFLGVIKAGHGEEVKIQDIEDIVYDITARGFKIALITFDRFQSVHIRQRLVNRGYVSAQMSVERCSNKIVLKPPTKTNSDGFSKESTNQQILSAFNCFKDKAYMGLMAIPYHELAINEVIKSSLLKVKNKVVPLPGMSIDIFHSMAGSVFNLVNNTVIMNSDNSENDKWKDRFYDDYDTHRPEKDIRDGSVQSKLDESDLFYEEIDNDYYEY